MPLRWLPPRVENRPPKKSSKKSILGSILGASGPPLRARFLFFLCSGLRGAPFSQLCCFLCFRCTFLEPLPPQKHENRVGVVHKSRNLRNRLRRSLEIASGYRFSSICINLGSHFGARWTTLVNIFRLFFHIEKTSILETKTVSKSPTFQSFFCI